MDSITGSSLSLSTSFKPCLVPGSSVSSVRSVPFSLNVNRFQSQKLRFQVSCTAIPETVNKVSSIVKKQLALPAETIVNGESKFSDLGADSLDTVEIVMGLEEEFGISVEEESAQSIQTVQDAANLIEKLMEKKKCA